MLTQYSKSFGLIPQYSEKYNFIWLDCREKSDPHKDQSGHESFRTFCDNKVSRYAFCKEFL